MISSIIQEVFHFIHPNMCEKGKKINKESIVYLT